MADEIEDVNAGAEATATADAASTEETNAAAEAGAEEAANEPPPGEAPEVVEGKAAGEAATEEEESEEFKPNVKFKAGIYNKQTRSLEQKEFDIDPKFHGIMTDPESEKLVRELHEKAHGLESVKERFAETRERVATVEDENRQIKGSIDGLRKVYNTAVKTGNLHKLDTFFQTLQIPQEVILNYAFEKVKLSEMPPEQRHAIMGQLESDRRAEELAQQQVDLRTQNENVVAQAKSAMVDLVLARPEVSDLQKAFDERVGKPGSFKAAVFHEGEYAFHREKVDLPPEQAVQRVIDRYALAAPNGHALPRQQNAGQNAGTPVSSNGKPIVQRTTRTIPNVQGRATSALPAKPRSVEDLKKVYNEKYGNQ